MRRRAAHQPFRKSLAAHLASLNTCRLFGGRTIRVNPHAPAGGAPAIPQKSGGAFGIPEYMPPIRRKDYQSKPSCAGGRHTSRPIKIRRRIWHP